MDLRRDHMCNSHCVTLKFPVCFCEAPKINVIKNNNIKNACTQCSVKTKCVYLVVSVEWSVRSFGLEINTEHPVWLWKNPENNLMKKIK